MTALGYTAEQTAAKIGTSSRTVESELEEVRRLAVEAGLTSE